MTRYVATSSLPVAMDDAFAYHERRGCLDRLTPPWETVAVESSDQSIEVGSRVVLKTRLFGVPVRWRARHTVYEPPVRFEDVQDSGPFAHWVHRHEFASTSSSTSTLTDDIEYRLPGGWLGQTLGGPMASRAIESMFAYRHRITADDLMLRKLYACTPKTIAISGAGGLVGGALASLLTLLGHRVLPIVRHPVQGRDAIAVWEGGQSADKLREVDVVVHLAGKSIAEGRWNRATKREIRDSRVDKTRVLCERLAAASSRTATLICASATGIYGDRGDEILDETSALGDDFLASVARDWESSCDAARQVGIRVVHARFGIVLSPRGGALVKMLTPAKLLGGRLGSGQQWWSWIGLDDVLGGIVHAIETPTVVGPVNFVAPQPVRNGEFATRLGEVLSRPALFPAPAAMLRLALGEMADALLLASTRVVPTTLSQTGYQFRFSSLAECLRFYLGKERLESVE